MTARRRRSLLAGLWLGGLGYVAVQCAVAALHAAGLSDLGIGYVLWTVLFTALAIIGAYYIVVRS